MSQGVNKYIAIGNLGANPEFKVTPNDVKICTFSIAANTKRGKNEHTYWVNCKAFNRLAEICNEYLRKGTLVYITGRMDFQQWEHEGQKYSKTEVLIDEMQMLGSRDDQQSSYAPENQTQQKPGSTHQAEFDDDIPF